ncbi:Protein phosphatase methylesterase 1 [Coemansia javaensis]|uniref:Protein phosphatase methylesterase 1 n=1 Tax=Coemansia javaensis TaxID=2761396 RepID=A0A9W8LHG3_9FUNG|nr:Protein phosphatase methylesterase 1 [Coemansia javaensis]
MFDINVRLNTDTTTGPATGRDAAADLIRSAASEFVALVEAASRTMPNARHVSVNCLVPQRHELGAEVDIPSAFFDVHGIVGAQAMHLCLRNESADATSPRCLSASHLRSIVVNQHRDLGPVIELILRNSETLERLTVAPVSCAAADRLFSRDSSRSSSGGGQPIVYRRLTYLAVSNLLQANAAAGGGGGFPDLEHIALTMDGDRQLSAGEKAAWLSGLFGLSPNARVVSIENKHRLPLGDCFGTVRFPPSLQDLTVTEPLTVSQIMAVVGACPQLHTAEFTLADCPGGSGKDAPTVADISQYREQQQQRRTRPSGVRRLVVSGVVFLYGSRFFQFTAMFKPRIPRLPAAEQDAGDLEPLEWSGYFDRKQEAVVEGERFNVYTAGDSSSSSSGGSGSGPIFVLHHGAGHSGLAFGLLARHLCSVVEGATVAAPDARGHGATAAEGDLTLDRMVDDLVAVFNAVFPGNNNGSGSSSSARDVVLVGHSMGGAVVAHACRRIPRVLGLVLIDIVEGSAMDSLHAIPSFIAARPQTFASVGSAIRWHIDAGEIQNAESARLSVPSLIVPRDGGWAWRTALLPTEPFWRSWYQGLSQTFAAAPAARLLILAGTDRLDKELLIAQMQGRFQLELLPAAGHTIQEDLPERVGDILAAFWGRNQRANIPVRRPAN